MCQLHISLTRAAQIYLELHFCVELHTKKALNLAGAEFGRIWENGRISDLPKPKFGATLKTSIFLPYFCVAPLRAPWTAWSSGSGVH